MLATPEAWAKLDTWDRLKLINQGLRDDEMNFLRKIAGTLIAGEDFPEDPAANCLRRMFDRRLVNRQARKQQGA